MEAVGITRRSARHVPVPIEVKTATSTPKRGPGRPSKVKPEDTDKTSGDGNLADVDTPAPKKRGRPPKHATSEETIDTNR